MPPRLDTFSENQLSNFGSSVAQPLNKNKVIKLYRFGDPNKTWRTTISTIFTDLKSAEGKKVERYMFPTSEVDVNKNIELLMDADPQKFKNGFGTNTPIQTFIDKITAATGKYGQIAKQAWNIASVGINAVNAVTSEFGEGKGYQTSRQLTSWVKGAPSWDGNLTPLDFSYAFTFTMGQYGLWDAKKEVVIPAFNLIAPVFPQYLDAAYVAGPIPNSMNFATNLISGLFGADKKARNSASGSADAPADEEEIDNTFLGSIANVLDEILLNAYSNFLWDIEFGEYLKIKRCIITNGDLEFSKETDDKGYPVYAKVELSFKSMLPPALSADRSEHMAVRFKGV